MLFEGVATKPGPSGSYIGLLFVTVKLCFLMYFSMCLLYVKENLMSLS